MRVVTDSCSDLTADILKRFDIKLVPLSVAINNVVYRDFVDLNQARLFELVTATRELPKTAAPTVAEYVAAFEGDEPVICVTISSKLSASYQNALLAASMLPEGQVTVVDSLNLSTGIGHLAIRAAELRSAGWERDAIVSDLTACIPNLYTSFVLDTLEYLYKGGRCTSLQSIVGSVLRIHPVIGIRPDGTLGIVDKPRGARQRGFDSLLRSFTTNLPSIDRKRVFITHTTCLQDAEYLAAEVRRLADPEELLITEAGSVIASHCGPNTIGILYRLSA